MDYPRKNVDVAAESLLTRFSRSVRKKVITLRKIVLAVSNRCVNHDGCTFTSAPLQKLQIDIILYSTYKFSYHSTFKTMANTLNSELIQTEPNLNP